MNKFYQNKYFKLMVVGLLVMFVLAACTAGSRPDAEPAGFFWGIWHGWIAPFVLIVSIFNRELQIYETNNIGFWYNLGFYLAIVGGFGSIAFFRKK